MKSDVITIFEDYPNKLEDYEKHEKNLYALRDLVGNKNFSLQTDGTLTVAHYVGFFQKGITRIQILPKTHYNIYPDRIKDEEISSSLDFIYRLLLWSDFDFNKLKLPTIQPQGSSGSDLLEVFIGIFIRKFVGLFNRNYYQCYVQHEENIQFIKGKINFPETIRRNSILRHLHVIKFDEYTVNNPLNQIFKAVMIQLLEITNIPSNKKELTKGIAYLDEVDLINLHPNIFRSVRFDRLNSEYEPLFNFAKLFFYNHQPGLTHGKDKTFSFLVPMYRLFENFIGTILEEYSNLELKYEYHKQFKWLATHEGSDVFKLQPDYTVLKEDKVITIMDAKYKSPFNSGDNAKIKREDLYQLTTYALCYSSQKLFLIYPKLLGAPINESILATYKINAHFGEIVLKVIQVDIMERNPKVLSADFLKCLN